MIPLYKLASIKSHPFDGDVLILELSSHFLAFDRKSRRQMRDSNGGVGDVDSLTAGAARPEVFKFEVLRFELDLRILDRRRHYHDASRSLKLPFLLRYGDSE